MVETAVTEGCLLDAPSLDPMYINTRPSLPPEPYPLDAPTCVVEVADGDAITAYRLRRPAVDAETGLDELTIYAQMLDREGEGAADAWLWERLALAIERPDAPHWLTLTAEMKRQVPAAHQRKVIHARYLCCATVLMEKSALTFAGGSWCVALAIGPPAAPVGVLECFVDEWDNESRAQYQGAGTGLAARLATAERIFDVTFQSGTGGMVAEQPFAAERRAEFLRWLEAPFKLALVEALAAVWDAPLSISMQWE